MRWLPNLLTLVRLALAPFAVAALVAGDYRRAALLFLCAAATDGLDGYLARRFRWQTRAGAYLDPVADKVLLSATYLAFGIAGLAPWWLVGLVFGRDVLILLMVAAALLFTKYRDFPPSAWGKISTGIQVVAAAVMIASLAAPGLGLARAANALLWLVAAATAWSGFDYLRRAVRLARAPEPVPR